MNSPRYFRSVLLVILTLVLLCSCGEPQDKPEDVALRFLTGEATFSDLAPDGKYESASVHGHSGDPMAVIAWEWGDTSINPFDDLWAIRSDSRTEYEMEIQSLIVRDSLRPNSKEITVLYAEHYNQIRPPWTLLPLSEVTKEDMEPVPSEQWHLTGEYISRGQVAFFIMEKLDNRWVVWCAEIDANTKFIPDICTY